MDDVDMAQDRVERDLDAAIKKARSSNHPHVFSWTGSCYCGLVEWSAAVEPHFCGAWCRDLYEREARMKLINGKV